MRGGIAQRRWRRGAGRCPQNPPNLRQLTHCVLYVSATPKASAETRGNHDVRRRRPGRSSARHAAPPNGTPIPDSGFAGSSIDAGSQNAAGAELVSVPPPASSTASGDIIVIGHPYTDGSLPTGGGEKGDPGCGAPSPTVHLCPGGGGGGGVPDSAADVVVRVDPDLVDNPNALAAAHNVGNQLATIKYVALSNPNASFADPNGNIISGQELANEINNTTWVITDRQEFNNGGVGGSDYLNQTDYLNYESFDGDLSNGLNHADYADPVYTNHQGLTEILLHELGHLTQNG